MDTFAQYQGRPRWRRSTEMARLGVPPAAPSRCQVPPGALCGVGALMVVTLMVVTLMVVTLMVVTLKVVTL